MSQGNHYFWHGGLGEKVWFGAVCAGLVALPLGGLTDSWGIVALAVAGVWVCITRPVDLWQQLCTIPVAAWLAYWLLWVASIAWSHETSTLDGLSLVSLCVIPAVVPLLSRPRMWMWPVVIGVGVQSCLQVVHWLGWVEGAQYQRWESYTAFHWYPANVGLWGAVGLALALALLLSSKKVLERFASACLVVLISIGVVLTLNRIAIAMACFLALLILFRWFWRTPVDARGWLRRGLFGVVSISVVFVALWSSPPLRYRAHLVKLEWEKIANQEQGDHANRDRFDNALGHRIAWWRAGSLLLVEQPLGSGAGTCEERLVKYASSQPSEWGARIRWFVNDNPHSPWVATAIQLGIPGLCILLVLAYSGAVSSWRGGKKDALLISNGPIWMAIGIFSLFHGIFIEHYTVALLTLVVAVSVCPQNSPPDDRMPAKAE